MPDYEHEAELAALLDTEVQALVRLASAGPCRKRKSAGKFGGGVGSA